MRSWKRRSYLVSTLHLEWCAGVLFDDFLWKNFLRRSAVNLEGLLPLLSEVRLSGPVGPGTFGSSSSDPNDCPDLNPRPS